MRSGGPSGRSGGPSVKSGTGRGTLGEVWGTLEEVCGTLVEGPVQVMIGRWTLDEVRDGSGDPRKGPRRVGGPTRRSATDRRILGELQGTFREVQGTLG